MDRISFKITIRGLSRLLSCTTFLCMSFNAGAVTIADGFQMPIDGTVTVNQEVGKWDGETYCGNHLGQDLKAVPGTEIRAIANGRVARVWPKGISRIGYPIHIEHILPDGSKFVSVYYHTKRIGAGGIELKQGQEVKRGEVIGYTTDRSKDWGGGAHLHLGIRPGAYDPLDDARTLRWFYPGYTAIHSPPPNSKLQCDQTDPKHAAITAEWEQSPLKFITDHPPPPPPLPGLQQLGHDGFNEAPPQTYRPYIQPLGSGHSGPVTSISFWASTNTGYTGSYAIYECAANPNLSGSFDLAITGCSVVAGPAALSPPTTPSPFSVPAGYSLDPAKYYLLYYGATGYGGQIYGSTTQTGYPDAICWQDDSAQSRVLCGFQAMYFSLDGKGQPL